MEKSSRNIVTKLKLFKQFQLNNAAAKKSSDIWASLKNKGKMIKTSDILIAGIILSNNYNEIITNDKHFENIKKLKVVNYRNEG